MSRDMLPIQEQMFEPSGHWALQCSDIVVSDCTDFFQTRSTFDFIDMKENKRHEINSNKPYSCQEMETLCEVLESVDVSKDSGDMQSCCGVTDIPSFDDDSICKLIYTQDSDGDTLLHSAIITLNEHLAEQFIHIALSRDLLNLSNNLKQTPLHVAVLTQQPRVVRRLIVGGADILSRDRDGNTPLHIACREGYTEIVRTLLEPVRYPETKQNQYDIPYQRIPQDLNITNYDGLCCLHLASSSGHLDIVTVLIDKQVDINGRDMKAGRTPLHIACVDGNLELVRLLLKCKDCNINARTYNNLTPFDFARDRGFSRISFELAAAGAIAADEIDMNTF